jgi:hypothetical protein
MPAPFNPKRSSIASLHRAALNDVSRSFPALGYALRRGKNAGRQTRSTIPTGDGGFFVGISTQDAVTAVYGIVSAYQASQFSIPFPSTADQTPPVKPERFFGPEIVPGASCLSAGLVEVNFGPGGTQRNGPGNPVESLTGPYNAYRVLDFCNTTPDATGQPPPVTFFLTPIDDNFAAKYLRPNESGLASMVSEVFSPDANAFTNPNATWFAILWNFTTNSWDITNTSQGNAGGPGVPGFVMAYSVGVNAPEPCPTIPPLIAQDTYLLDPVSLEFVEAGFDSSGLSTQFGPGANGPGISQLIIGADTNSVACFTDDSTGPASYTFNFIDGKANADWLLKLKGSQAPPPH